MSSIKINYSQANEAIKNLSSVSTYINSANNNCNKAINIINANWKGNSASAIVEGISKLKSKASAINGNTQSISSSFNQAVKEIKKADEKAKASIKYSSANGGAGSYGGGGGAGGR